MATRVTPRVLPTAQAKCCDSVYTESMEVHELKVEILVTDVLSHYGWEDDLGLRGGWTEWQKTRCPFHDDTEPSATVNVKKGRFHCFVCDDDRSLDIFDIVQREEGLDFKEAKTWIEENFL